MLKNNELDWQGYESITKFIYQTLGKDYGLDIECFGNQCKVKGKSGVHHQIDVLTKQTDGKATRRTVIECKFWNNKVTKGTVMELLCKMQDAGI